MQSSFIAVIKITLIAIVVMSLLPVLLVASLIKSSKKQKILSFFCGMAIYVMNLRVKVRGRVSHAAPVLYVSNHSSYLDILILSKVIGMPFAAKSEIGTWPLFGQVGKLTGTVFIARKAGETANNIEKIRVALKDYGGLILFAEGTTNDGNRVLPFKSSLFSIAEKDFAGSNLNIQPIAITYTRINNISMGKLYRPYVAWYGNMSLVPHLWNLLKFWSVEVEVLCLPIVKGKNFNSRKEIAEYCYNKISNSVENVLTGRKSDLIKEITS